MHYKENIDTWLLQLWLFVRGCSFNGWFKPARLTRVSVSLPTYVCLAEVG